MSTPALAVALVATAFLGVGCTPYVAPAPPSWSGPDTVDTVSADAFVGDWRLVALNPADGAQVPERTLSYAADGTFTAEIVPSAGMERLTGDEPIRTRGTWRLERGRLVHSDQRVEVSDGDGGTAWSEVPEATTPDGGDVSEAEVYEIGPDRVVIVTDDGGASALERR